MTPTPDTPDTHVLRALGSGSTSYRFDRPDAGTLETFASPFAVTGSADSYEHSVRIEVPEFTSLCPKTGQPDFAKLVIDYGPAALCVESKSLKLYLMQYRQHGAFHEACVNQIAEHLIALLRPRWLRIEGRFAPRGGITFWPTVSYTSSPWD